MNSVNDRSRDIGPFVPGADDDMLICRCEEITKGEIRQANWESLRQNLNLPQAGFPCVLLR